MKTLIKNLLLILVVFLLLPFNVALAQESQPQAGQQNNEQQAALAQEQAQIQAPLILNIQYEALLEYFINKAAQGNVVRAYEATSKKFQRAYSFDKFQLMLKETGLALPASWVWTNIVNGENGVLVTGKAGTSSELVFELLKSAEKGIQINSVAENVTLENLAKRVPAADKLTEMVKRDLSAITVFVKKNKVAATYKYLSPQAKKRTKMSEISKAFRFFRKAKWNVAFTDDAITIDEGFPQLNPQGLMLVQGKYRNKDNTVNFTFAYDYEWQWKLGVFSINVAAEKEVKDVNPPQ